jgi:hypothetical protein
MCWRRKKYICHRCVSAWIVKKQISMFWGQIPICRRNVTDTVVHIFHRRFYRAVANIYHISVSLVKT